ncbi:MAG: putative Alpha/beta fold family hydrolase [Parcubacteria group bacterium]|nr:putative Alpha/beta fold family hydrolase [Parcubacteria group bacterium]
MKNALILHGTGTKNTEFWFPYVKKELEKKGFDVWLPQLPHDEVPNLKEWVTFVLEHGKFTEETIIIGHSAGAQLILSLLEKVDVPVKQAILVSGYARALRADAEAEKNEKEPSWEKIKDRSKQWIFINSDNDPWGCDDKQGRIMLDHLGGTQIILHGEGHMGSTTYDQPYKEFPLILQLVEAI